MPKDNSGKVDPRTDLTGVGTPEVGAPTVEEMKEAGQKGKAGGLEKGDPEPKDAELDREGMTGYRQTDAVLGSEGNTN